LFTVDAIYLAARSLGMMLVNDGADQLTNGTLFRKYSSNTQFTGVSGRVALDVLDMCCDMQVSVSYLSQINQKK
jgi:hypothetical protein